MKDLTISKSLILLILIIITLICSISAVSADSSTIYVSVSSGNDSWDGQAAAYNSTTGSGPKLSIKNATGTVSNNGIIYIENGLYLGENNRDITIDKNITIQGQRKEQTIIDAKESKRIFYITYGTHVNIANLTFANGKSGIGGAICNSGSITIENCNFLSNTATDLGGAIFNSGNCTIFNSTFNENDADGDGGAIYNNGIFTTTNCTFTGNDVSSGGDVIGDNGGGAILNKGTFNVANSTFTSNKADNRGGSIKNSGVMNVTGSIFTMNTVTDNKADAGAIYNEGTFNINNSTISGSRADNKGGAIFNKGTLAITHSNLTDNALAAVLGDDVGGAIANTGTCTIEACNINNNYAKEGGGAIFSYDKGVLTINNSTFMNNLVDGGSNSGGAIYIAGGDVTIQNSIFRGNEAQSSGGAIFNGAYKDYNGGTCTITGCSFTNNTLGKKGVLTSYGGAIENSNANISVNFCRFYNNEGEEGSAIGNYGDYSYIIIGNNNWWGSNNPDFTKLLYWCSSPKQWLYMTINATPNTIHNFSENISITVSFNNIYNGKTITPLNPVNGYIPDGTLVWFFTPGTPGTTVNGLASISYTVTQLSMLNIQAQTDNQLVTTNVTVNRTQSKLQLTTIPSKINPKVGNTVIYTIKVSNNGPDTANDVVMTYILPEGLEFINARVDCGTYNYNPATRTLTWNMGDVPVGDPYMWLYLYHAKSGKYVIKPTLSTSTYDPTINRSIQSITMDIDPQNEVNAQTKTVPMQETGIPYVGIILAILMVLSGFYTSRRR